MYLDLDLVYDEIQGWEIFHLLEVNAVIDNKVKGDAGEVIEFYEEVDSIIDDFEDILLLKKKESVPEIIELRDYIEKTDGKDCEAIDVLNQRLKIAEKDGAFESFGCVHNDTFYLLHDLSL
jgi:hypothetical protein